MESPKVIVDCYGHPNAKSDVVRRGDSEVHFLFNDCRHPAMRAHVGLYVDYMATLGRNYLRYRRTHRVALLSEPNASLPFVEDRRLAERFSLIMTHDNRLISRGAPYVELPYGTSFVEEVLVDRTQFNKTKLLSMIGAYHPNPKAAHVFRNVVLKDLAVRKDIDLFGKGVRWIESKLEGLAPYAFSIAMENNQRDYYFTEKIIDCFLCETVPIYYGMPSIERYFDRRGMICFETLEHLHEILAAASWSGYGDMMPYVLANKEKAIAERWATRNQMLQRVADQLISHYGDFSAYASRTVFRLAQNARNLLFR